MLSDVGLDVPGAERVRWDGPWSLVQTVTEIIALARDDLMLGGRAGTSLPQEFLRGEDLLSIVQSWTTTAAESSGMVRRRSTVRFRNGALAQRDFSNFFSLLISRSSD